MHETDMRMGGGARFHEPDPPRLVFGRPSDTTLGLEHYMCVPPNFLRTRMAEGVAAIRQEVEDFAATREARALEALECLEYVQHARAGSSPRLFPNSLYPRDCDANGLLEARRTASGEGMTLDDFVEHEHSRAAQLERAHVLALRLQPPAGREDGQLAPRRGPRRPGHCSQWGCCATAGGQPRHSFLVGP